MNYLHYLYLPEKKLQAFLKQEMVMLLTVKSHSYKNILKIVYLLIEHAQFAYNLVLGIYIIIYI